MTTAVFLLCFIPSVITLQASDLTERFDEALQFFHYKEYSQSLEILDELSEEICSQEEYAEKCVKMYVINTNVHRNRREYDEAGISWERGNSIAKDYLDEYHPLFVRLYTEHFYLSLEIDETEQAADFAQKALDFVEKGKITGRIKAMAYVAQGRIKSVGGDFRGSIENYNRALEVLYDEEKTIDVINVLAMAHNNIGVTYRRLGMIDKTLDHYATNLDMVRGAFGSDHIELAYAYNSMGTVYFLYGDYGTAGDYFYRSAVIFQTNQGDESPGYATAINNSGASFYRMRDFERAAEMFEMAQRIKEYTLGQNHPETALGYSNLGSIYTENENFEKAEENFRLSIKIRRDYYGEGHPNLASPLLQFGTFYIRVGDYNSAREFLHEALELIETSIGKNHPEAWEIRIHIGRSYIEEQKFEEGRRYVQEALWMMIDESGITPGQNPEMSLLSHPVQFLFALQVMGDLHLKSYQTNSGAGHLFDAFYYYEFAIDVIDFLQTNFQNEASKLSLIDQHYSIYTNSIKASYYLYKETGQERWIDEIYQTSEMSRSKIALQLLQEMDARSIAGVSEEVLEKEMELNSRMTGLYQQLNTEQAKGDEADQDLIIQYRDSIFYLNEEIVRFMQGLEQQYPAYYELKYDRQLAERYELQALLTEDETLVKYVLGEVDIFIIVVDSENISVTKTKKNEDLADKIRDLREGVTADSLDAIVRNSASLFEQLIEPVLSEIRTNSLIIVPDQELHYLPFELLLSEKPGHNDYSRFPYLIKKKQIKYAPSATILQRMTQNRPERPRNLLAMAPFNQSVDDFNTYQSVSERYYTNLSPLPLTRYETREIASLFRKRQGLAEYIFPNHTDILLDRSASKEFITNQSLNSYSWIHFATHAFVNESHPNLSGIAFWGDEENDGILYLNEIYNLRMNADLVVLSACETGMGTAYRGEGLIGFTRAFIHAGAANLVVSMWRVNDQPTSDLMIRFYRYIREGHSYGESLRNAKIDLIAHPDYAEPRHWAAFILQGR
ncbi:MAG: CHAT domain-containing protein [Balneolaceae bacterium]|nr:CHAT domain-containing protein [Balneolaceae bacterium]